MVIYVEYIFLKEINNFLIWFIILVKFDLGIIIYLNRLVCVSVKEIKNKKYEMVLRLCDEKFFFIC